MCGGGGSGSVPVIGGVCVCLRCVWWMWYECGGCDVSVCL